MDVALLRQALAAHLGADGFRKFVAQLHQAKRLRYWQEGAWRAFVVGHPEFDCTFDELRVALRICEVHGRELEPDDVGIFRGCRDYTREYSEARGRLFPNAPPGTVSTEGAPFEGNSVRVWYCEDCRTAEWAWSTPRRHR